MQLQLTEAFAMADLEDEEETLSSSDLSSSSDDYVCEPEEDFDAEEDCTVEAPPRSPPSAEDCKSKNVDALVKYVSLLF